MYKKKLMALVSTCLLLLMALLLAVTGCTPTSPATSPSPSSSTVKPSAEPIVLTAVTYAAGEKAMQEDYMWSTFREKIFFETGGKIKFDWKGGPEVIPAQEQFSSLTKGIIDVCYGPASFHSSLVPEIALMNMFLQNDAGLLPDEVEKCLRDAHAAVGAYYVGVVKAYHPWVIATKKETNTLAELKKLKIGVTPSAYHEGFAKEIGTTPIKVQMVDYYTSLERGLVDGCLYSPASIYSAKLYEVVKYVIGPPYKIVANSAAFINLKKWNSIPKDLQDIVSKAFIKFSADQAIYFKGAYQVMIDRLQAKGMGYIAPLKDVDLNWWYSLYGKVSMEVAKKEAPADRFAKIEAVYNSLTKK